MSKRANPVVAPSESQPNIEQLAAQARLDRQTQADKELDAAVKQIAEKYHCDLAVAAQVGQQRVLVNNVIGFPLGICFVARAIQPEGK